MSDYLNPAYLMTIVKHIEKKLKTGNKVIKKKI